MTVVDAVLNLDAVVVRPGDTLLIRLADVPDDPAEAEQVRISLQRQLPDVNVLIVWGVDQLAVHRPDGDPPPPPPFSPNPDLSSTEPGGFR